MGRLWKSKFSSWNLDKKIYAVITGLSYAISIIMLAIFTTFYISSFIGQSNNIANDQLTSMAANYESTLDSYKEFAEALIIDDSFQQYLKCGGKGSLKYYNLVNGVKNTLQNALNLYTNMRFIAVVSYNFDDTIYKSTITKISNNFRTVYKNDYTASNYSCEAGTLRISYNDAYLKNNNMLNVYMPIYNTSNMIHELGLLSIIFDNSLFEGLPPEKNAIKYDSELIMVDTSNLIVTCTDTGLVGSEFEYSGLLKGVNGNFVKGTSLYNYRKVGKWNYFLISRIPLMKMYRDNIIVVALLVLITVAVTYFGLKICKGIIDKTYQPLDNVIRGMNDAADSKLDVRINMENVGVDFVKLANGFNYMMEEIKTLMEQVKLEQHQMDQIRFNALQSQIQPHFLYNTLDCIHWQASADGNEELSVFVKALAQYYRLCLSKGKDVICLEQEIDHVRNYLIIQNIRYDNIISSTIELEEDCKKVLIPKITLQPLVENSIYHGIKIKEGKRGELRITARKKDGDTLIVLEDNGTGMTEEQIRSMNNSISEYDKDFGYGIRNVNKRIEILFGKEYGLHYFKNESGGVTVTIRLPGVEACKFEEVM